MARLADSVTRIRQSRDPDGRMTLIEHVRELRNRLLKVALAISFIIGTAAEFIAAKSGIGYLIWNSWELLQVDYMFVGILVIGILGLITSVAFNEIERKLIPWKAE